MPGDAHGRRVVYHGRVQGVGFRLTAHGIALRYPVRGWVRNLSDGTVELVVIGSPASIRRCLDEVAAAMQGHITDVNEADWTGDVTPSGFEIRY